MDDKIRIVRNHNAIDALILQKGGIVDGVFSYFGGQISDMAAIGDELLDLPLLTTPGLGMVGAPANAQERVLGTVGAMSNGYVSPQRVFDGFFDFYRRAGDRGIKLIISDKDGVLKEGKNLEGSQRFRKLAEEMGQPGKPYVVVLTGSSLEQNKGFMEQFGLDQRLALNPNVRVYPYLLLLENGAIHLNVLTGEMRNYVGDICPELLKVLKGEFESRVRERLETRVLPDLGLEWSDNYNDQRGKVYHVRDKISMVTFNIPREDIDGKPYRNSSEAETLRSRIVGSMETVAKELQLPYEVIS